MIGGLGLRGWTIRISAIIPTAWADSEPGSIRMLDGKERAFGNLGTAGQTKWAAGCWTSRRVKFHDPRGLNEADPDFCSAEYTYADCYGDGPWLGWGGGGGGDDGGVDPFVERTSAQRQRRRAEIDMALAAIAQTLGQKRGAIPLWPVAIKLQSMCGMVDTLTGAFELDITYAVYSNAGTIMVGSQLDNINISEAFVYQDGNLGDLNSQRGVWSRANNELGANGTFLDGLSSRSTGPIQRYGNALQVFVANGSFGSQPLGIWIGGSGFDGVNAIKFSPTAVSVNGLTSSTRCGGK